MKPVLIYSQPKTGTTTVMRAIQSAGLDAHRVHNNNIHKFAYLDWTQEKVVTMVRDPIARNISEFFESGTQPKTTEMFLGTFPFWSFTSWYYPKLNPFFGVDLLKEKFARDVGFRVINKRLLVIRTENLSRNLAHGLSLLLGGSPGRYIVEHRASGHDRFDGYADFLDNATFDSEFLDTIYDTEYVKHFYYVREVKKFRERWSA